MKFRITSERDFGEKKVSLYNTEVPNNTANLAFVLIEKWGLVLAAPDGESTDGRQKLRLLSPKETVARAFDVAEEAIAVARARGLMVAVPDLNEINAKPVSAGQPDLADA